MMVVLGLFGMLFFVMAILGLFMPNKLGFFLKSPTRMKTFGAYFCAAMLMGVINAASTPKTPVAPDAQPPGILQPAATVPAPVAEQPKPAETKPATPEDKLYDYANGITALTVKTLGHKTNGSPSIRKIVSVEPNYLYDNKGNINGVHVNITLNMDENLTANMTTTGIFIDTWKLMKAIFTDNHFPDVKSVYLNGKLPMIDKYGKQSSDVVVKLAMTREIADKLNWDNVLIDNYKSIFNKARQVWLHPTLR